MQANTISATKTTQTPVIPLRLAVLDRNRGHLHRAIVLKAVGGQLNGDVGQRLALDGHVHGDGEVHELLVPGTTSGGEVQYALNSATSKYDTPIPTATAQGDEWVLHRLGGDGDNHRAHIGIAVVGVALYLIIYCVSSGIGLGGEV